MPQTLYDKIWNEHIVHQQNDGTALLYVDRHLIHEVTSPQAFEGLRLLDAWSVSVGHFDDGQFVGKWDY